MRKKGFTLIELLSIVIILSIVMLITVPLVLNHLKKAEKKSFDISVSAVKKNTENYLIKEGLKKLPDCDKDIVYVDELELKNKKSAFSLNSSYICYNSDSDYKCNYIYALSKNANFLVEGCYEDVKVVNNDKSKDYTPPFYDDFEIIPTATSLTIDIEWYDDESEIVKKYYSIRKHGTSKWSDWQTSNIFTGLKPETKYDVKSMAINKLNLRAETSVKTGETTEEGAPECYLTVSSGTMGSSGYYKTNVNVTMKTSEVIEQPISYSGPITSTTPKYGTTITSGIGTSITTITQNGTTTLYGYVKNSDGKKSNCIKTIKKDTNPASVSISGIVKVWNDAAYDYDEIAHTSGTWTYRDVTLKANITEGTQKSGYKSTYTYQWLKDGVSISGATKSTYTTNTNGTYTVKVTSGSGKSVTSSSFVVKVDKTAPSVPSVGSSNYGRSLTFSYSSTDSQSGIDHYQLKYKKSSDSSWSTINNITSTSYSVNTSQNTTYNYIICAYNKSGLSACSSSKSITTYTGIASGTYSSYQEVTYAGKQWYVVSDSGSYKGSTLTLLQKSAVGSSGGNTYNNSLNYLNSSSYLTGILSSDCQNGGINKQSGYCVTSNSGNNSYASAAGHPYWIGSGQVVANTQYNSYYLIGHTKAAGAAGSFYQTSHPNKDEISKTYYSYGISNSIYTSNIMSVSNSAASGTYQTVSTNSWYGSDYYIYFQVRPYKNDYRLSITKYAMIFDCYFGSGDPLVCAKNEETKQTFTGTGKLAVKVCGGSYHNNYLSWIAGTAKANFTYGAGKDGAAAFNNNRWSRSESAVNAYAAGASTSTTVTDSKYGVRRIYDNVNGGNCVNFQNNSIGTSSLPYYYRPYIVVRESYTA